MKQMGFCGQSWCTHLCQRFYVLCSQVEVVLQRQQVYGTSEDTNDHLLRPQVNPREAQVRKNPCTNENRPFFVVELCDGVNAKDFLLPWKGDTPKLRQRKANKILTRVWLLLSVWWTLQPPWVCRSYFTHFQEWYKWYKLCIHFSVQSKLHWN